MEGHGRQNISLCGQIPWRAGTNGIDLISARKYLISEKWLHVHEIFFIPKHSLRLQRIVQTFLHNHDQILWQAKKKPDSPTHFLPGAIESGNLATKEGTSAFSAKLHHLWTRARGGRDLRGGGIPFFLWDWKIRQVAQNSRSVCKCWGLLRWVRLARRWAKTGRKRNRWMKGGTYKFG